MMHGCVVQATLFSLSAGRKNTERLSPGPSPYGNMPQPGKTRPPKKTRRKTGVRSDSSVPEAPHARGRSGRPVGRALPSSGEKFSEGMI